MLQMKISFFYLLLSLGIIYSGLAQHEQTLDLAAYRSLNYGAQFPEELLSSRSVVFVSVPPQASGQIGDWKGLAAKIHPVFRDNGVDAVAYFNLTDILSGPDANKAFVEGLKKRQIDFVVLLSKRNNRFELVIAPFNGENTLIAHGESAWKDQNSELEALSSNLYKSLANSGLEKSNYLIIDQPEFFADTQINNGQRFPAFLSDLKIDKLAVPYFPALAVPETASADAEVVNTIKVYNQKMAANNKDLTQIFSNYPFEYELVDSTKSEDILRKGGFQYVLSYLHTTGDNIRQLLNYPVPKGQEGMAGPDAKKPVYKFYIRHIFTGDIYLGTSWDAAPTWQEALNNHINNLRKELKVNQ